jgi:hypothetical protein
VVRTVELAVMLLDVVEERVGLTRVLEMLLLVVPLLDELEDVDETEELDVLVQPPAQEVIVAVEVL